MKKIFIYLLFFLFFFVDANAQTVTIYRDGVALPTTYATIKSAMRNSIENDSLVLSPHTFYENSLGVFHSLIITGTYTPEGDSTVIDAEKKGEVYDTKKQIKFYDCIITNGTGKSVIKGNHIYFKGKTILKFNDCQSIVYDDSAFYFSGGYNVYIQDSTIFTKNTCTKGVVGGNVFMNGDTKITQNNGIGIFCYYLDIRDNAEISYNMGTGIMINGYIYPNLNVKLPYTSGNVNIYGNVKIIGNIAQPIKSNDPTMGGGIVFYNYNFEIMNIGENVIIADNKADVGGGIWTSGVIGILDNVKILRNEAKIGAAIYSYFNDAYWENVPLRMVGNWEIAYNNCNGCGFLPDSKAPAIFSGGSTVELYGGNIHHNYGYGTEGTSVYMINRTRTINADNIRMFNPNTDMGRKSEIYLDNKDGYWIYFFSKDCWWGRSDTTGLFKIYGRSDGEIDYLTHVILDWKLNGGYKLDPTATEWEIKATLRDNAWRTLPDNSFPMLKAFHSSMVGVFKPSVSNNTRENTFYTTYEKPDYAKGIAVKSYIDEDTFRTNSDGLNLLNYQQTNIKIHPNPAYDYLNIDDVLTGSDIYVNNIMGQQVYKTKSKEIQQRLDISSLAPGIYILSIHNENSESVFAKFEKK